MKRRGFSPSGGTEVAQLATLTELVSELQRGIGRLPYETDIQGLIYLLQEGAGLPLHYRFRMTSACPHSDELRADLERLSRFDFVRLTVDERGDGNFVSSGSAEGWLHSRRDRKVSGMLQAFLEQVAHTRSSLDLLATAHFVVTRLPDSERRSRTRVYSAIKAARPTASEEVVRNVLTDLDSIRNVSFEMAKS